MDGATVVNLQFLDGEAVQLPFAATDRVVDLINAAKVAKPPPGIGSTLTLLSPEGNRMDPLETIDHYGDLVGATLPAAYGTNEKAYLVSDGKGGTTLLAEGDVGWDEKKVQNVSPDKWVQPPETKDTNGAEVRNLAKESEGASVSATSNIFGDPQKLNNVIRLGAGFGDPRYVPGGDNTFIFGGGDMEHKLYVDFGKDVILSRVGSMCYSDRWVNRMIIASSEDSDPTTTNWQIWGSMSSGSAAAGVIQFDRDPTRVRLLRFDATSGHCPGARIGPVFAYGVCADAKPQ